jgi:hypothetical protein
MMIGSGRGEPEQPGELVGDTFVLTVKDLAVGQVQQVRCEFANTGRRLRRLVVQLDRLRVPAPPNDGNGFPLPNYGTGSTDRITTTIVTTGSPWWTFVLVATAGPRSPSAAPS